MSAKSSEESGGSGNGASQQNNELGQAGTQGGGASAAGPSPLTVGKRFVKQYYQVLSTTPEQIHRFYQASSVLSHGEGRTPTTHVEYGSLSGDDSKGASEQLKDRFYLKDLQIRFEFERGAIDAQPSVNGGILLSVTGQVVYYPTDDAENVHEDPIRKAFVHTFFLGATTIGPKRSYYVHNDILRFLTTELPPTQEPAEDTAAAAPVAVETSTQKQQLPEQEPATEEVAPEPPIQQQASAENDTKTTDTPEYVEEGRTKTEIETNTEPAPETSAEIPNEEAPGGGVEETKEEVIDVPEPQQEESAAVIEEPPKAESLPTVTKEAVAEEVVTEKKENKHNVGSKHGRKGPPGNKNEATKAPTPSAPKSLPGSWASLVAGGAATAPTPSSPPLMQPKPVVQNPEAPAAPDTTMASPEPAVEKEVTVSSTKNNGRPPKRDPDCTLVIKNLADNTKEADVLALFEPFAAQNKAKVVGINVSAHKGIAFVDYDSVNPVLKALEQHKKEAMRLLGRALEVDQKTRERRRPARRGNYGGKVHQGRHGSRGGSGGGGNRGGR